MSSHSIFKHKLENGLTLLIIDGEFESCSVGVFVKVGSRDEPDNLNGISHFMEHMMFKGNKKMSGLKIAETLDSLGAKYNAETSHETTCYYVSGQKDDLEKFVDILLNIYLYPLFKTEDIIAEKGVVIEELNMVQDDPHEIVGDILNEKVFRDSNLKNPIIGNKKNILSFTRDDLVKFRNMHYIPSNTVLVVCANLSEKEQESIKTFVEKKFKDSNTKLSNKLSNKLSEKNESGGVDKTKKQEKAKLYVREFPGLAQTNLLVTFKSCDINSPNNILYDLVSDVLASGSSSRLFQKLRNKLSISYFNYAYNMAYRHEGVFVIHVGIDGERVDEAIDAVMTEIKDLRKNGMTKEELKKAIKIRQTALSLANQTPHDLLTYYGIEELNNNHEHLKIKIESYDNVSLDKVNSSMKELFEEKNLNIIVFGAAPKLITKVRE